MLENRAAELERLLGRMTPEHDASGDRTGRYPVIGYAAPEPGPVEDSEAELCEPAQARGRGRASAAYAAAGGHGGGAAYRGPGRHAAPGGYETGDYPAGEYATGEFAAAGGYRTDFGYAVPPGQAEPDERTEVLIKRGRSNARRTGAARWLGHWRAVAISIALVAVGAVVLALLLPGRAATWPASVAQVQSEISVACQNPNVVSEPAQVNFACAKGTRQILWVFSLLTSDDKPDFSDAASGREGLEPISPQQGGDVAWSLNLHHPYNPDSPVDSLAVAARAINDIIGGATLTSSKGAPLVQPGLESSAANCARYTGSSALLTRQGFPAVCALPVTSAAGQAALVRDVFQQWMVGSTAQLADEAGVLFENAGDPGNPQVQAILNTLANSGL